MVEGTGEVGEEVTSLLACPYLVFFNNCDQSRQNERIGQNLMS